MQIGPAKGDFQMTVRLTASVPIRPTSSALLPTRLVTAWAKHWLPERNHGDRRRKTL
jgi:hypothetical protein